MHLSPDLLVAIQEAINAGTLTLGDPGGRSKVRRGRFTDGRQLDNLTLLPTKDDPRPTFFWSAVAPRDGVDLGRTTEFPKLMWHGESGTEVTVLSTEDERRHHALGFVWTPPAWVEPDPMEAIRAQWDALSPDDQALLLESQKQDRIAMLKAKLSALPEAQLAEMLASQAQSQGDVVKRGPGRPRKDSAA